MEGTCQCLEILFLSWKGCVNVSRFYFEHGRDVSVSRVLGFLLVLNHVPLAWFCKLGNPVGGCSLR